MIAPAPEVPSPPLPQEFYGQAPRQNQDAPMFPLRAAKLSALAEAVQVWLLPDSPPTGTSASNDLYSLLSADEQARAASFYFPVHRAAYVTNRGHLRILLAQYLDCRPETLHFVYGAQGKPEVAEGQSEGLTFNLSHTEGLSAIAVSRGRRVGVDVEAAKPASDLLELARHHFAPTEYQQIASLPLRERHRGFYTCWTRKEAFLKGLGTGLTQNLPAFEVSLLPEETAALLACQWSPELCQSWRFHALDAGDRHLGALAYELHPHDPPLHLQTFTWSHFGTSPRGN